MHGDIYVVWKIVETAFQHMVVSKLNEDCPRRYNNFLYPGSGSATEAFSKILKIFSKKSIKSNTIYKLS